MPIMENENEVIKGYIEHFIYRNSENGYSVVNLVTEDDEIKFVDEYIKKSQSVFNLYYDGKNKKP